MELFKDIVSISYHALSRPFIKACDRETVLLYHSIGNDSSRRNSYKLGLEPGLFRRQAEFISSINRDNIIFSFDDGFINFYDKALPVISRHNIRAIIFITVGFIEGRVASGIFAGAGFDIKPLTWEMVRDISSAGIEIGSHAITHPNLLKIGRKAALMEINDSKKIIEDKTGKEATCFAYPYGGRNAFNSRIKDIVKNSGYKKAYTNIMGFNTAATDPYELRRIRIYDTDNMFRFRLKIDGAYNWADFFNNF